VAGTAKAARGGIDLGASDGVGFPTASRRFGFLLLGIRGSRSARVFGPKTDGALLDVRLDRPRDDSSFPCLVQLVFTSSLASLVLMVLLSCGPKLLSELQEEDSCGAATPETAHRSAADRTSALFS
jgi:hypothetical protein